MPPKTVEPPRFAFLFGREEGGEGDVADIDLEEKRSRPGREGV